MSNTIDQRVVEMRFDNAQFERNVSTTMSTLDKLKQKLNLSGAAKGLDNVNNAAKNVNMNGLGNAVETVSAKFSALQVMGVTALANITNSAVNAGKRIVKSLTVDPIKSGFSEYETKMGSIQTILANTEHQGTKLTDVTTALDELNTYADKTIYNFQQMTKNIGTFTAAGLDLDTSVKSIKGIANLAAVSGSTSQQASTAMYQLSQALASGTVKLQDWNSVVNAGMGGKVFQNALIRTAAMLDGSAKDVEAWQKENVDKYGSFRESLTRGAWMTTEVLSKTLEQFTMAAEEGSDQWNEFKKSLMSSGYTEKQADEILKMANTATDAATKVKTFTQLLDTIAESAQSGWAQTWEIIVGDFEEAKAFFTELSDLFGGIIGKSADRRNSLFGDAFGSNWEKLIKQINEAGVETDKFEESIKNIVGEDKLDRFISDWGSVEQAVRNGAITSEDLKKALDDVETSSGKVALSFDKFSHTLWWGHTGEDVKQVQEALKALNYDLGEFGVDGIIGSKTSAAIKQFQKDAGLNANGAVTKATIQALEEATAKIKTADKEVKGLSESCDSLLDVVTKTSGRELLLDSLMNVIKAIQSPLAAVGEALRDTLSVSPEQLYNALEALNKFTSKFVPKGLFDDYNWDAMLKKIESLGVGVDEFESKLSETLESHGINVNELITKYGSLGDAFKEGAINFGHIKETLLGFDGVTDALIMTGILDVDKWEELIKKVESLGIDVDEFKNKLEDVLKKHGVDVTALVKKYGSLGKAFEEGAISFDHIKEALLTFEGISDTLMMRGVLNADSWDALIKKVEDLGISTDTFKKKLKDVLKQKGMFEEFAKKYGSLQEAFEDGFITLDLIKETLLSFDGVSEALLNGGEAAEKVRRTFAGLFAIVKTLGTIAAGPLKLAFQVVTKILGNLGLTLLDVTAGIGDALVNFSNKVNGVVDKITTFVADHVSKWLETFRETEFFKTVAGWFTSAGDTINEALDGVTQKLDGFESSTSFKALSSIWGFLVKIANNVKSSELFTSSVNAICNAFTRLKTFIKGFKLPEFNLDNLTRFTKMMANTEEGKFAGFMGFFAGIADWAKGMAQYDFQTLINKGIEKFAKFWIATGDKAKLAFEKLKEFGLAVKKFIFGTEEVNLASIMAIAEKFMMLLVLFKTIKALNTVVAPLDNVTSALANFAKSLKWDAITKSFKAMAVALGVLTVCIVILASLPDMGKAWQAVGMLSVLLIAMGAVVTAVVALSAKWGGKDALGAAISLLAVIGGLVLLVYAIKELDNLVLKNPGQTFMSLFAALLVMTLGIRAISKAGGSTFKSVAAILTLMTALKMMLDVIDAYDTFDWSGKTRAIDKMLQMLLALSVAIRIASGGTKAGASSAGLALTLLAMVFSLKILLGVIQEFAALDTGTLVKGGLAVIALLGVMTWMMVEIAQVNKGGILEKGQKAINPFTGLALALVAVIASIYVLGKMAEKDSKTLINGGIAVGAILLAFTAMIRAVGNSCSGLKIGSVLTIMGGMAFLMAEMAVIIFLMRKIPWQQSLGGAASMSLMMVSMVSVLKTLNNTSINTTNITSWIGAMAGLGIIMWGLANIMTIISGTSWQQNLGAAAALSALILALAGVLKILSTIRIDKASIGGFVGAMVSFGLLAASLYILVGVLNKMNNVQNAIANASALSILAVALSVCVMALAVAGKFAGPEVLLGVIGMVAISASLGLLVTALNGMSGVDNAINNAVALSILAGALSLCMIALSVAGIIAGPQILPGVIGMVAIMYALQTVVAPLAAMDGLANARENAITLALLAAALSLCMLPLALAGMLAGGAIVGVVALAALMWSLNLVVDVLTSMEGLTNARENADVLANLAKALSICMLPLTLAGSFAIGALVGVGALALLMTSLKIVVSVLSTMDGLSNARANADILIDLLNTMTKTLVVVSLLAPLAAVGIGALAAMTTIVGKLGLFVAAVGALMTYVPKLEDFVDKGLDVFKKLAGGFGEIISAFVAGLMSELPDIGESLSSFMDSAGTFLETIQTVDESALKGAGYLSGAIVALLAADFVAAIASLRGLSLADLATDLSDFGDKIGGFMTAMGDMDTEAIAGVESLCSAVNALTAANLKDAWTQILPGDNSLSSFGKNISDFATCIKDAAASLSNITDTDVENIKRSATAGEALATLNASIPRQGGWVQDIIGSKELTTFGESINAFADCLVSYAAKVSGKSFDTEAITASATAAQSLADLNSAIPKQGGWAQDILGAKDLATFGNSITAFADCLVQYSNKIAEGSINADAISQSATAAGALAELNGKLPSQNGLYQAVVGEKNMGEFGTQLVAFADGLVAYANAASQIDQTKIDAITASGTAVDELVKVVDKVPESGGWDAKIFGESDGQGFGAALSSMASGIRSYVNMASTIPEDAVTIIQNSGEVIDALATELSYVPLVDQIGIQALLAASTDISNVASLVNSLNGFTDYSGVDTFKTQVGKLATMLTEVDTTTMATKFANFRNAVTDAAMAAEKIFSLNGYTYDGVDRFKAALESLAGANIDSVINTFSGKAESMASAMDALISSMTSGISGGSSKVSNAMKTLMDSVMTAVTDKSDEISTEGDKLADKLKSGLEGKNSDIKSAGGAIGDSAVSGARSKYFQIYMGGKYLGAGFAIGVRERGPDAYNAGYYLGEEALRGIQEALREASPSKEGIVRGKYLGEGLVIGIDSMAKTAYNSGSDMGQQALNGISNSINKVSDAINSDIDAQPTIRPVLDLSDVESGAGRIGSLLGSGSTVGVMSNVGAISTMMNRRSQNGVESEVVSAINKLRRDLSGMTTTQYNINGITYDNSSEIAGAMQTIVRAARQGRRV